MKPLGPLGEALAVAREEIVAILLGVRALVFVVVYGGLLFGLGAVHDRLIADKIPGYSAADVQGTIAKNRLAIELAIEQSPDLEKLLGGPTVTAALLDGSMPIVLFVVLLMSAWALPGLIVLLGYDRIAEDLGSRYARFVLQRVRRGSFLAGKLIGHVGALLAVTIVIHALMLAVAAISGAIPLGPILAAVPKVWCAAAIVFVGYAAFTSAASSWIAPPFAALLVSMAALVVFWVLSFGELGRFWMGSQLVRIWVLDPIAVAVVLGNAAVFIALAYLRLRLRDV